MDNIGKDVDIAARCIKQGELVVFPTETVYGIGADAFNVEAVKKIYIAKNRPMDNPLIVHISSMDMLNRVVDNVGEIERKIMDKFWPGPISIVIKKNKLIPNEVTASLNTVSVRMPDNSIALKFIKESNTPIAAPSANVSGKPSGTVIEDIYEELKDNVSYFLDGGKSKVGIESTVVKVEDDKVIILRPGKVTKEDLLSVCDKVIVDENCLKEVGKNEKVLSPGMKHKHYSPNCKCIMINFDSSDKLKARLEKISNSSDNKKIAVMLMSQICEKVGEVKNISIIDLGKNLEEVANNIFYYLRKLDKENIDICYIQGFDLDGLGLGITNRVIRACGYNVENIT